MAAPAARVSSSSGRRDSGPTIIAAVQKNTVTEPVQSVPEAGSLKTGVKTGSAAALPGQEASNAMTGGASGSRMVSKSSRGVAEVSSGDRNSTEETLTPLYNKLTSQPLGGGLLEAATDPFSSNLLFLRPLSTAFTVLRSRVEHSQQGSNAGELPSKQAAGGPVAAASAPSAGWGPGAPLPAQPPGRKRPAANRLGSPHRAVRRCSVIQTGCRPPPRNAARTGNSGAPAQPATAPVKIAVAPIQANSQAAARKIAKPPANAARAPTDRGAISVKAASTVSTKAVTAAKPVQTAPSMDALATVKPAASSSVLGLQPSGQPAVGSKQQEVPQEEAETTPAAADAKPVAKPDDHPVPSVHQQRTPRNLITVPAAKLPAMSPSSAANVASSADTSAHARPAAETSAGRKASQSPVKQPPAAEKPTPARAVAVSPAEQSNAKGSALRGSADEQKQDGKGAAASVPDRADKAQDVGKQNAAAATEVPSKLPEHIPNPKQATPTQPSTAPTHQNTTEQTRLGEPDPAKNTADRKPATPAEQSQVAKPAPATSKTSTWSLEPGRSDGHSRSSPSHQRDSHISSNKGRAPEPQPRPRGRERDIAFGPTAPSSTAAQKAPAPKPVAPNTASPKAATRTAAVPTSKRVREEPSRSGRAGGSAGQQPPRKQAALPAAAASKLLPTGRVGAAAQVPQPQHGTAAVQKRKELEKTVADMRERVNQLQVRTIPARVSPAHFRCTERIFKYL
jgi:hypothetical protein